MGIKKNTDTLGYTLIAKSGKQLLFTSHSLKPPRLMHPTSVGQTFCGIFQSNRFQMKLSGIIDLSISATDHPIYDALFVRSRVNKLI